MQGVLKFANLAVIAIATMLVASVGIVGANELGVISGPFGDDNSETFNARVVSVSETLMFVQRDADHVFLRLNDDTRFEDEAGHEIERDAVQRDSRIAVRATFDFWRLWDAHSITLLGEETEPTPEPTPSPEATPAPTPEPTPAETPQPTPVETPKPEPAPVVTPKPTEKPVATPKPVEKPAAKEFWGIVTGVQGGGISVDSEVGAVFVHTNGETQYPDRAPVRRRQGVGAGDAAAGRHIHRDQDHVEGGGVHRHRDEQRQPDDRESGWPRQDRPLEREHDASRPGSRTTAIRCTSARSRWATARTRRPRSRSSRLRRNISRA